MKSLKTSTQSLKYLDVSQYIIQQYSPLFKPQSLEFNILQVQKKQNTPQIPPIDHDMTQIILTPITTTLIVRQIQDCMEDFRLQRQLDQYQSKFNNKKKRLYKKQDNCLQIEIFRLEGLQGQLHQILQDYYNQDYQDQDYYQESSQSNIEVTDHQNVNSNTFMTNYFINNTLIIKNSHIDKDVHDDQNIQTIDIQDANYHHIIQAFSNNPKTDIIKKIHQIQNSPFLNDMEKKDLLKKYIVKYYIDYQMMSFQENWKQLPSKFKQMAAIIKKKTQKTFNRYIGGISYAARRVKLLKYLQKKKGRIWRKKVSYDCRKKVADGRLRIKGKFVTRDQACIQLGVSNLDMYTAEQIKNFLQKRLQNVQQFDQYYSEQFQ